MRDLALITDARKEREWYLDIDIINGYPRLLEENQTPDQRAAVAAVQMIGTIPGMPSVGVDWGQMYVNEYQDGLINIDNQIKQSIQETAYVEGSVASQYSPQYGSSKEGIALSIAKVGGISNGGA